MKHTKNIMMLVLTGWLFTGVAQAETWTMQMQVVSQTKDVHPLSKTGWQDVVTTSWAVLDLQRDGSEVRWTTQVCGLETSEVRNVRTEFPDAFIDGLTESWSAELEDGVFVAGPTTAVFGAEGADLAQPSDDDGDGNAGVTVRVSHPLMGKGEVFVAQRATSSLVGEQLPDGRIVGVVSTKTEQQIYGATQWWLKHPLPQRAHPDSSLSTFEMAPAPAGSTCATGG